jgi:hypothetical protein
VIATFLLYHAVENPEAPLPFKSAIFICGGLPLPVVEDLGLPVPAVAWEINDRTGRELRQKVAAFANMAAQLDQVQLGVGLWDDTENLSYYPRQLPNPSDVFGLDFTTFSKDIRVKIPTAHIFGAKDPRWPASIQLAHFCDNGISYDHGGGHEIPRTDDVSSRIAEVVRALSSRDCQ